MAREIQKESNTLNGVTFGAWMVLAGMLWFAIPYMTLGRTLLLPQICILLGVITTVRHLFINASKNKYQRARKKVVKRQVKLEPKRSRRKK